MENTEILINNEDQVLGESEKVINQMIDHVSKIIEETNDEGQTSTTANQINEENTEKNDDGIVPSTTSEPNEEQENVTNQNTTASKSGSPIRMDLPLKEVGNRKREFDGEDEQVQEKILDGNQQASDQTKKLKIIETKEPENNLIVNDISAVEV